MKIISIIALALMVSCNKVQNLKVVQVKVKGSTVGYSIYSDKGVGLTGYGDTIAYIHYVNRTNIRVDAMGDGYIYLKGGNNELYCQMHMYGDELRSETFKIK